MSDTLKNFKVAILAEHGFEQSELLEPQRALQQAGAETVVVSPQKGSIKGWQHGDWGQNVPVDRVLSEAKPEEFDALLLPGGVINPDRLRMNPDAMAFIKHFLKQDKPVAAICHGPWLLVEADAVRGRKVTSWPSVKTDILNAGGNWVDTEAVVDGNIVTSRKPDDIPIFNQEMISLFAKRQPALQR